MIVYNVTFSVEKSIDAEWKKWMKENYLEKALNSGYINSHKFLVLVNDQENTDGKTYAVQLYAESFENLEKYVTDHMGSVFDGLKLAFQDRQVSFATILEEVEMI
ncbi:DUF4286 family protein [Aureibacter tunicatorum]|uniref:DUF4286 family protein n=1 Tax=Aureibacter tunicatorum TaxID=866807 RepID=A0AAE4BQZ0_9BACT|nr:DUF4286 family protein [Aureibacter tunicatorum]MDR6237235.1 hypothetical protein [Aureibacter tunicatorum]BDD06227.1 hypothetical protein AUTU_37100 [Aureibacter tunicatorum]